MNESLVKYLAGLLDADGSLSFAFKSYPNNMDSHFVSLHLRLASSDAVDQRGFVSSLPELTGMGGVSRYGSNRQFLTWAVTRRAHLEMLLPRIIKHMVVKAQHWQWMLEQWRASRRSPLSLTECDALKASSKDSRLQRRGPIHPKNHPTWAWLAGYIDGDGWYRYIYQASPQNYWSMHIGAVAHDNDADVLQFLQRSFGGSIREHSKPAPHIKVWVRNLGERDRSFALRFLPNLAKHSRLKRHKIDQMIHHHRQRLSVPSLMGQAIV